MQVNIIMQKENENTLASAISSCLEDNAKKAYFFIGNFKETGYKIIEEDLIDTKAKLFFAIGIDKKNTTRSMLDGLLSYTDDVYFYSNNNMNEFVSNVCVFEYASRAVVYVSGSNVSESGIQTDLSLYTKLIYDLNDNKDKQDYKAEMKNLKKIVEDNDFTKLTKTAIEKLVENKEIFSTRQYNHSVMSISELLNKKDNKAEVKEEKKSPKLTKEEIDGVYKKDIEIPKVDLSDMSIDIEMPEIEEVTPRVKKEEIAIDYVEDKITLPKDIEKYEEVEDVVDQNSELYDETMLDDNIDYNETLDINDMLFSKADIKLDVKSGKEPKKKAKAKTQEEKNVVKVKKVNLNNVTSVVFEASAKNAKEEDTIRVANYLRTIIPEFFGIDDAACEEINGVVYKVKNISVELLNAKTNDKYLDKNAKLMYKPKQSYLTFVSEMLRNIVYEEDDIIRIIKLSDNEYQIEIINKKMQEYKVWSKICNQKFRASTKKFGIM